MKIIVFFQNLVALVTGSAQTLGKSTAEMFLRNGAKVILCDLPKSNGAEVAETLGSDVTFVPTDITSEDDVRNALAITQKTYGRLNVVVNCTNHLVYEQMIDKKKNHAKSLETITHSIKVRKECHCDYTNSSSYIFFYSGKHNWDVQCDSFGGAIAVC